MQVRVLEHNGIRLAAKLHQAGLEVSPRRRCQDAADLCAAGKVDLLDVGMGDEGLCDCRRISRPVEQQVEHPGREAGLSENVRYGPVAARRELCSLEDGCVSRGQGERDGAKAKVIGGVPKQPRIVRGTW